MSCRPLALVTALLLVLLPVARAQAPVPGSCTLGTATGALDVSDVAVGLYNTGSLFFGAGGQAQYVVPRVSGLSPVFAAGLWVGGRVNGELRFAGARYAGFQFWPGPLGPNGRPVNPADCSAYDRIWVVSVADVAAYDAGGPPTADLAQWPYQLGAGVVDGDGNPTNYDLAGGDRPRIYGSQTAFWVMNDVGNVKGGSGGPPSAAMGLEVRVHAFVVASQDADLARATFYRYTLVYKGEDSLEDARLSLFADADLGDAVDDYVHSDTTRGMLAVYNADEFDGTQGGYGAAPPAFGFDLLDGAGAASFWVNTGPPGSNDPGTALEYHNFQQGLWGNGQPVREGGFGYGGSGPITTFTFPGDPVTGAFWSEENTGPEGPNSPGDRRMAVSSAAFTLHPGDVRTFDVAMLYGRGENRLASVTALRAASDRVQALHDSGALYLPDIAGPPPTTPAVPALLAPADGADFGFAETVVLDWAAVPEATEYLVEVAADSAFADVVEEAYVPVDSFAFAVPIHFVRTYHWRVRAFDQWVEGPRSEAWRFTAYGPYAAVILGVEEWDASGPITTNADGSATDPSLLASPNSTRTQPPGYLVGAQGAAADDAAAVLTRLDFNAFLTANIPNDYELRWVAPEAGHAVFNRATGAFLTCWETGTLDSTGAAVTDVVENAAPVLGGLPRLPFQLWEVAPDGSARPVQAVVLQDDMDGCYSFTTAATGGAPFSQTQYERIYGTRVPYDEVALTTNPAAVFAETLLLDADHQAFGRLQVVPYLAGPARPPQAGSRIRILTTDPPPGTSAEGTASSPGRLAVEAARPNPIRGEASLRFTVGTAGPARVTLYDVLGREVAVLLDGPVAAGPHAVALDGRRLAPGAYVVMVTAGEARASRVVTVVR